MPQGLCSVFRLNFDKAAESTGWHMQIFVRMHKLPVLLADAVSKIQVIVPTFNNGIRCMLGGYAHAILTGVFITLPDVLIKSAKHSAHHVLGCIHGCLLASMAIKYAKDVHRGIPWSRQGHSLSEQLLPLGLPPFAMHDAMCRRGNHEMHAAISYTKDG